LAIRDRVLSFDLIPILITKAPILYSELSEGVNTSMTLDEAIRLGLLAKDIPEENIKRGVIGTEHIILYTTPAGDQVLKPLPDKIRQVRDEVFGAFDLSSPLADLTLEERVQAEAAKIAVLNGTFTEKLASRTLGYLNSLGLSIPADNAGNAADTYIFTTIIDYTGNPHTIQLLAETFNVQSNRVLLRYDPASEVAIEVNLGSDWAGNNPMP
ncbi:MAG: LCP family protein, partial [Anaerolineales bacterium]